MANVAELQAVILAAGEGDRLGGPYPKPFTPVNGVPVVSRLLRDLTPIPTTLIVRSQDLDLGVWAAAIAGHPAVDIVGQPPMSPADRLIAVERRTSATTAVLLGDNVYWPEVRLMVEDMTTACREGVGAYVLAQPNLQRHGLEHKDGIVSGRRWRRPYHDIGVYMIPEGFTFPEREEPIGDASVLGLLLDALRVDLFKARELTWFDIGTPADLARADLFLRAKEGPCGS